LNVGIMTEVCSSCRREPRKGGRKAGAEALTEVSVLESQAESLKAVERDLDAFLQHCNTMGPPKEKKVRVLEKTDSHQKRIKKAEVPYVYSNVPGRRFVQGKGSQGLPRRILQHLLPEISDLDIKNAVFTICSQIVSMLKLADADLFEDDIALLHDLAKSRNDIIRDQLEVSQPEGKDLLLCIMGGKAIPERWVEHAFVSRVQRLSRMLRWLAASCLPQVYSAIAKSDKTWPEASMFAVWWQRAEDRILKSWQMWVLRSPVRHLSLHFDGIRLDKRRIAAADGTIEEFNAEAARHIAKESGFQVAIEEKLHRSFMELITSRTTFEEAPISSANRHLMNAGNCIPRALWRCAPEGKANEIIELARENSIQNRASASKKCRSYRECCTEYNVHVTPHVGMRLLASGVYLIHSEGSGEPHCAAMRYTHASKQCEVFENEKLYKMQLKDAEDYVRTAYDKNSIVTFAVSYTGVALDPIYSHDDNISHLDGLFDLCAGARKDDDCDDDDASVATDAQLSPHELSDGEDSCPEAVCASVAKNVPENFENLKRFQWKFPKFSGGDLCENNKNPLQFSVAFPHACVAVEASDGKGVAEHDRDDGEVDVAEDLAKLLKDEHEACYLKITKRKFAGPFACPHCPARVFGSKRSLCNHFSVNHEPEDNFVASGTKQVNVIQALFDNDRLTRREQADYLRRSADFMRRTIQPPLECSRNLIDRDIVMVLDHDGPRYCNRSAIVQSARHRRIGYTYYSKTFADLLMREAILHHGKGKTMIARICVIMVERGCEVISLLPTHTRQWLGILEDVFRSPFVVALHERLFAECVHYGELQHISIDGTIRIVRRIKGQADYRCSAAVRNACPIPDDSAKRRVISITGRAGSVLGLHLVKDETGPVIAALLEGQWGDVHRRHIISVCTDAPSRSLYHELKSVAPNLEYLALDPVHLPIVYEHAFYKKKTEGSKVLRALMHKFNKVTSADVPEWGPAYAGDHHVEPSKREAVLRLSILDHSYGKKKAQFLLEHLDLEEPWRAPLDFVEALAAFSALFEADLGRRTHLGGVALRRLLFNAAAPGRTQWYFNNQRLRHSIPRQQLSLLSPGTARNEAFHAELNGWFRNQPELYASTVELQLRVNGLGKMLAHNTALHSPTLRQLTHTLVLSRSASAIEFDQTSWNTYCAELVLVGRCALAEGSLPLRDSRRSTMAAIKQFNICKRPAQQAAVLKRPACYKKPAVSPTIQLQRKPSQIIRRTPFTLKRTKFRQAK